MDVEPLSDGTGNCFFVALQIIHDFSTAQDVLPIILRRHGIDSTVVDFQKLFLVHGTGLMKTGRRRHAWIELDSYAIDYSNENQVIEPKEIYYDPKGHDLVPAIFLEREQVLRLILSDPHFQKGLYWGDYTKENLDQMQQAYNVSTYQDWNRNFLQEHEDYQRQSKNFS